MKRMSIILIKTTAITSNLYGYIDKSILDYKFDSLKTTITVQTFWFYKN
jgi:hypothetical protein